MGDSDLIFPDVLHALETRGHIPEDYMDLLIPKGAFFFSGWTRRGAMRSDTNVINHIPVAHSLIASIEPQHLRFPASDLPTNFWTMLVGPAYTGHKTWSISSAQKMLTQIRSDRVETQIASVEAVVDKVIDAEVLGLYQAEFGNFLSASAKTSSKQHTLRQILTELWDSPSRFHRLTLEKQKKTKRATVPKVAHNPRVSLTAGVTPAYLERYTTLQDWEGGFLSRFCIIYTAPERSWSMAQPEPEGYWGALSQWLEFLSSLSAKQTGRPPAIGPCAGFDAKAAEFWDAWYDDMPKLEADRATSAIQRGWNTIPIKAAMHYALDRMISRALENDQDTAGLAEPWFVTYDDLVAGTKLAELHTASVLFLTKSVSDTYDGRLMRTILNAIPPGGSPHHEVLQAVDVGRRKANELLITLQERHQINKRTMADGLDWWFRTGDPAEPRVAEAPGLEDLTAGTSAQSALGYE